MKIIMPDFRPAVSKSPWRGPESVFTSPPRDSGERALTDHWFNVYFSKEIFLHF